MFLLPHISCLISSYASHRTPVVSRSFLQATPRTPTPFKNALEMINKRSQL